MADPFNNREDAVADMLRHMLGINDPSLPWPPRCWRDYAAVEPGDPLFVHMQERGLVRLTSRARGPFSFDYYATTEAGKELALSTFKAMQWSKSKRRYCGWLRISDAVPDLSFRDYLTKPEYAEHRSAT